MEHGVAQTFVGRDGHLTELMRAFAETIAGRGRLVLLAGEPGIGKTRLADELAAHAASLGARVLWASCWDGDGAPAFWPWIQVIRAYGRDSDVNDLERDLGSGGAEVARLVPELAERGSDAPGPALAADSDRFRLFDAVATLLKNAAATRPLVVVLDDLHWSDQPSLRLLRFLVRDLRAARLLVVGTYRDVEVDREHPLAQLLGELSGDGERLILGGLSGLEVRRLVAALTGDEPADALAAAVHRQSGGNPFFVKQLVGLLTTHGTVAPTGQGVREVIERRLARLSGRCAELLQTASVIGQDFRLDLVEAVAGSTRTAVLEALSEAITARLVEAAHDAGGEWRFAHAVVRDVVYDGLGAEQRARLHHRVGEAIEARFAAELESRVAALAHHFLRAELDGDAEKGLGYAIRAGRRAMALLAYEDAADHFERALQAIDTVAPDDAIRRGELLLALGQARMAANEVPAARAAYERAAALAREGDAPALLARAALGVGLEFTAGVVDELEVRLLEEARRILPTTDDPLRARVLARLAKALLFTPNHGRRLALSQDAVAIARRLADPKTLAAVLYDRHVAIWGLANAEERLAIATEVIELAERHADPPLALQARALRMGNLLELGNIAELRSDIEIYERTTRELRQLQYLWHVPLLRATQSALVGDFDEAERLAAEGKALGERAQHQGIAVFFPTVIAMIRYLQGRFGELADVLGGYVQQFPSLPTWRSAYAYALCEDGRMEDARREFEVLAADSFGALPRDFTWATNLGFLALTCAALSDERRAAKLYDLLLPFAPFNLRTSRIGIVCTGPAAHYLGLLAASRQNVDAAVRHFEAALVVGARLGSPPFVAITQVELAHVLLQRGRHDDRERARDVLDEASATAEAIGNRRLAERSAALRRATVGGPLSPREVEVVRLIAAGRSNQEIAEELGISPNTVLHHVTSILGKTAATNRAEAAVYAARHGLLR